MSFARFGIRTSNASKKIHLVTACCAVLVAASLGNGGCGSSSTGTDGNPRGDGGSLGGTSGGSGVGTGGGSSTGRGGSGATPADSGSGGGSTGGNGGNGGTAGTAGSGATGGSGGTGGTGSGVADAGIGDAGRGGAGGGGGAATDGGIADGAGTMPGASLALDATLRFKTVFLQMAGTTQCATVNGTTIALAACGTGTQAFRAQILGPGYVAVQDDASGQCVTANGSALRLADCTNAAAQQFSFTGSTAAGYQLTSLGGGGSIAATLSLGATAASILVKANGNADPLAVVVDERPIGWATIPANIVVPTAVPPTGNEATRAAAATTGGGTWEAARAKNFSNVTWFTATDFTSAATRERAVTALQTALRAAGPSIVLLQAGQYDFSLTTPAVVNSCNATCAASGTYTQTGGFCPDNATCATTAGCVVGGFSDPYRTLDVGSDKTIIGLGAGAQFSRLGIRFISQHNIIYRNIAHTNMPGSIRAWDDGLLFWPADHAWVDHVSFSGFGRGAVVLSGTRVADGTSFATFRDSGWITFSWLSIDSSETWRCGGAEDSPYPFFTTDDPSLTFHHVLFQAGHGRNPAIDGEGAHFFNVAWSKVSDGLDGRNAAKLLVEGSWFDGVRPIRMDDAVQPVVRAPFDANAQGLGDARRLNFFSAAANTSLRSDWASRSLDVNTLNTNAVAAPTYPYSLDTNPSQTLTTVTAGAGVGKGGFPACSLANATTKQYTCP